MPDLVEVRVVLRNKLRRNAEQYVGWSVMLSYLVEVRVGLLLSSSKSFAGPCLVDNASGIRSTPRAAAISLAIELQLLGIVPDTKRLEGNEVVSLSLGKPLGVLVVDDLVDRLKVFHSSPVAGEKAGMTAVEMVL